MNSRLLKEYNISRVLGVGGFGVVFECRNRLDKQGYAVKVTEATNSDALKEVQVLVKLPFHQNVVQYKTCWQDEFSREETLQVQKALGPKGEMFKLDPKTNLFRGLCIQMELCGNDLRKYFAERNSINEIQEVKLFMQLVNGLEHIHEFGIIHRDLKPENVFVSFIPSPVIKIGDFGISTKTSSLSALTTRTAGAGTELYSAPEQMSTLYDNRVDIYALGIILMEFFKYDLQPKFNKGDLSVLANAVVKLKFQRQVPSCITSKFPQVSALVMKLTAPNPDDRLTISSIKQSFGKNNSNSGGNCSTFGLVENKHNFVALKKRDRGIADLISLTPIMTLVETCYETRRCFQNYSSNDDHLLAMKVGDLVTVLSKNTKDNKWWKGSISGKEGFFLAEYTVQETVICFKPFISSDAGMITIQPGNTITVLSKLCYDKNLWKGQFGGSEGYFPASFTARETVRVGINVADVIYDTPVPTDEVAKVVSKNCENKCWVLEIKCKMYKILKTAPIYHETVRSVKPFFAESSHFLTLGEWDLIKIISREHQDKSYFVGMVNEKIGLFPTSHAVQQIVYIPNDVTDTIIEIGRKYDSSAEMDWNTGKIFSFPPVLESNKPEMVGVLYYDPESNPQINEITYHETGINWKLLTLTKGRSDYLQKTVDKIRML